MNYTIHIGNKELLLNSTDRLVSGNDEILINSESNLVRHKSWDKTGYVIKKLFDDTKDYPLLCELTEKIIVNKLKEIRNDIPGNFNLVNYHKYIPDKEHEKLILKLNPYIPIALLPVYSDMIKCRVEEIAGIKLKYISDVDGTELFHIRIARPGKYSDVNPPHKDIYIDRLKNKINIYIPICGSNYLSSLPLIPGSHYWNEKDILKTDVGAIVNSTNYKVNAIFKYKNVPIRMIRPNPLKNEILIFSPYLIHGGGFNFNKNKTRFSLEMRFENI